jgi:ABC-2 type transport system ATP-binding protein
VELRQQLWENVLEMNKNGTTVVLTTHYLEEAQELCDEIAIINHGKLIVHDSKRELLSRIDAKRLAITVLENLDTIPDNLTTHETELSKDDKGRSVLTFSYQARKITAGTLLNAIGTANLTIHDVSTDEADLEDIFLQLTRNKPNKNAA